MSEFAGDGAWGALPDDLSLASGAPDPVLDPGTPGLDILVLVEVDAYPAPVLS